MAISEIYCYTYISFRERNVIAKRKSKIIKGLMKYYLGESKFHSHMKAQFGNYGILLSLSIGKYFVKLTILSKQLYSKLIWRKKFFVAVIFSFFHTVKVKFQPFSTKFREIVSNISLCFNKIFFQLFQLHGIFY